MFPQKFPSEHFSVDDFYVRRNHLPSVEKGFPGSCSINATNSAAEASRAMLLAEFSGAESGARRYADINVALKRQWPRNLAPRVSACVAC